MRARWSRDMDWSASRALGMGWDLGMVRGALFGSSKKLIDTDECLYLCPRRCDGFTGGDSEYVVCSKLNGLAFALVVVDELALTFVLVLVALLGVKKPLESARGSSFPSQTPLRGRWGLCDRMGDRDRGGISGLLRVGDEARKDALLGDPVIPAWVH